MRRFGCTNVAAIAIAGAATKVYVATLIVANPDFPPHRFPLLTTAAIAVALGSLLACLAPRRRLLFAIAVNVATTALIVADLLHFRFYGDVLSVGRLLGIGSWALTAPSVASLLRWHDLLWFCDLIGLAIVATRVRSRAPLSAEPRRRRSALLLASVSLVLAMPGGWVVARDPDEVFFYAWERSEMVGAVGLAGYHAVDAAMLLAFPLRGRVKTAGDVNAVEAFMRRRESQRFMSPLAGVAAGKNVVLLSAESLQAFALDLVIAGEPIAPHFRAFAKESLNFTEFFDQTHLGTTADAEVMVLTSVLPPETGIVSTRYSTNLFRSAAHVLAERGYNTLSAVAEPPAYWNMREMHPALGFQQSLFAASFKGKWVGAGLDDVSFFSEMAVRLRQVPEPYFAYLISSSNHHPFKLPPSLQSAIPDGLAGTMAGDYVQSVRYFDRAFGGFVDNLRATGALDRSIVIVYGDHQAALEEPDLLRLWRLQHGAEASTQLGLWKFRRRVPLLVRLPGGMASGERLVPGGHLDIAPTLLSLVGDQRYTAPWLGRDLTAPSRRLVVLPNGSFTNGQTYRLQSATGARGCFDASGVKIGCRSINDLFENATTLARISDQIVKGDLVEALTSRFRARSEASPVLPPRVLVIAHRGMSLTYPENTIPAIAAAVDGGADAVEVDIHLSRDGTPFVFHDDTLERTTNGRGLASALSMAELKRLDAGAWMDKNFAGVRIPTLEEVLRVTRGRAGLLLDLKMEGMARAVAAVYARVGVDPSEALIGGWTATQRADFSRHMPGARVLRTEPPPSMWRTAFFDQARQERLWGFELGDEWPADFVGDAVLHGMPVIGYTVNDEPTMRRLLEIGVSGIETDDPLLLKRVLTGTPLPSGLK